MLGNKKISAPLMSERSYSQQMVSLCLGYTTDSLNHTITVL